MSGYIPTLVVSTASGLAWKLHVRTYDVYVMCQGIVGIECLFLGAKLTPKFRLAVIMDGIFASGEIVAAAEDSVERLAGTRTGPLDVKNFVETHYRFDDQSLPYIDIIFEGVHPMTGTPFVSACSLDLPGRYW